MPIDIGNCGFHMFATIQRDFAIVTGNSGFAYFALARTEKNIGRDELS